MKRYMNGMFQDDDGEYVDAGEAEAAERMIEYLVAVLRDCYVFVVAADKSPTLVHLIEEALRSHGESKS